MSTDLASGLPFLTTMQLRSALGDAGVAESAADAIVDVNEGAKPYASRSAANARRAKNQQSFTDLEDRTTDLWI
ncbi:hypothetical protein ACFQ6H_03410 [Rhodococcus sp. NPDC056506]|uniref:hypothetical protein n=1 Tax=Rhodococcus sp. NPDC056506 TaxID=3345844 RepID=UPI00366B55CD